MIRKINLFFDSEDYEKDLQEFSIEVQQEIEPFYVKWFKIIPVKKEKRRIVISGLNGSPMNLLPVLKIRDANILCQGTISIDFKYRNTQLLLAVRPIYQAMIPIGLLFIGFKCFNADSFRMQALHHIGNWW